jgi:hypothetical protein
MQLQTATRKRVKIKILLSSPTGFGKTFSALRLAYGMTGDWSKIAVIDTENRSASLYADNKDLGPFQTIEMRPPYTIADFKEAVDICYKAGIEVIIADSVTHYWGEVKAYVDRLGSGFQNWMKGTPMWNELVNTILQTDTHFICTARKKQAYEMTKTDGGKVKVEKKGLEDQIRDGFDYEMTVAFDLINDQHIAKAAKDRTGMFMDSPENIITEKTGQMIKDWCNKGAEQQKQEPKKSEPPKTEEKKAEKPTLTDKAFTTAVERISKHEEGLLKKIMDTYTLSAAQKKVLRDLKFLTKDNKIAKIDPEVNKANEAVAETAQSN